MEEQLSIMQLQKGDMAGLEYLVRKYFLIAVRASYLIVQDQSLAEDIVQTCFLNASEKIDQFDITKKFGPWFLRSVINYSITVCKKQSRFVSLDIENDSEHLLKTLDWLPDYETGPEDNAITEEIRQAIWAALGQLSPQQRAAIVMRYYLNLKENEITQELNKPLSTVKWLLYSARTQMRKLLSPIYKNKDGTTPIQKEEIR